MTDFAQADTDLDTQRKTLLRLRTTAQSFQVTYPLLRPWLLALDAILAQAADEAAAGATEGEDEARRAYLLLAERMLRVVTRMVWRADATATLTEQLSLRPFLAINQRAWYALRGVRQSIGWLGQQGLVTGRLPVLGVSAEVDQLLTRLDADILTAEPLTWGDVRRDLTTIAGGLQWRA